MTTTPTVEVLVTEADRRKFMLEDIREGLWRRPRAIPPVWFYDEVGSRLFDQITKLPEYYLTRAERSILEARAGQAVGRADADTLVEIGSGTSDKTRLLLDAMASAGQLRHIVLLDISEEVLREAAMALGERYGVEVHAVVGDFRNDLGHLPRPGRRLWAFLGSTIGNFEPGSRHELLGHFTAAMCPGDSLLLGTDLRKDVGRLVAAYDDAEGVTARFNLNVLAVLNRTLGADFDLSGFDHVAVWNPDGGWIEMRLRSRVAQRVVIPALDMVLELGTGEEILTEISSKFDPPGVGAELRAAGLTVAEEWTDRDGDFMLTLSGIPG